MCTCTSGSSTSNTYANTIEERCESCEHLMSLHSDYVPTSLPAGPSNLPKELFPFRSDPHVCPRTNTVAKLAARLDEKRVVHVRGTPASGKTILANLLWHHYLERGERVVFTEYWPLDVLSARVHLARLCREFGYHEIQPHNLAYANIVFIMDEAQQSYGASDSELWNGFIKQQAYAHGGPRVCLFSSYGSPSTGATQRRDGTTPHIFDASRRVSIALSSVPGSPDICLFYNEEEFEDVVTRTCEDPTTRFRFDPAAHQYLYSVTSGHPGAVSALLHLVFNTYRSMLKKHANVQVTKELLIQALDDEHRVFEMLKACAVNRSFPSQRDLTPQASDVLRKVLVDGSISYNFGDPGFNDCYEMGWIHSEATDTGAANIICVLPSKLHEKFVEYHLSLRNPKPFPLEKFPTLIELCDAVLRKFSPKNLLLSLDGRLATSAKPRPPEAQFQDGWYRAFKSLLGHDVAISSDWSRYGDGRIDFRIVGPGWGVELLRDGDRLAEHCNRFFDKGAYHQWIKNGWVKDWIILDCRHSEPRKYNAGGTKLWRVIFKGDYSSARVLDCDNREIIKEFTLTNSS